MKNTRLLLTLSLSLMIAGSGVALLAPRPGEQPIGEQLDGSTLVSTNQVITAAGKVQLLEGARPKAVAVSPGGTVAVLAQGRVALYSSEGEPLQTITGVEAGPLGIAWSPDGATIFAAMSGGKIARIVREVDGKTFRKAEEIVVSTVGAPGEPDVAAGTQGRGRATGDPQVAGLAVSANGSVLFVALGIRNAVAVLDAATGKVLRVIPVGAAPYHLKLSPDGRTLAVACRGGRIAEEKEPNALSAGTAIRVDPKTDAAKSGGIALVDTGSYQSTLVEAGRQPGGMVFSPDGRTLYAASTDDDTLVSLDVAGRKVTRAVTLRPAADPGFGQIPTDVAVSADGKNLFVSCGGSNAVAVVDAANGKVQGHIPTGWFPIALLERDGNLVVASSKGLGGRVKRQNGSFGVHGTVGMVQFIPASIQSNLAQHSQKVAENNRWGREEKPARPNQPALPVPERVGEPSVFKHVVFIIKENQTYSLLVGYEQFGWRADVMVALYISLIYLCGISLSHWTRKWTSRLIGTIAKPLPYADFAFDKRKVTVEEATARLREHLPQKGD